MDEIRLPWETDEDINKGQQKQEQPQPEPSPETNLAQSTDSSRDMWDAVIHYKAMGLSVMWGRAQDEIVRGKLRKAKSPLVSTWSSEPEATLTLDALSKAMINANTKTVLAPIIICGKASGNLIAIDIDIKHWPGIDTRFFKELQDTFPHIWDQLYINQTPSKGFHLLYRTEVFVEIGNLKLAYKADQKQAGIETRGHGGYIMAPPGMGYTHYKGTDIPTFSLIDHQRIIDMASLYNEERKQVKLPSQKNYESIYDINPFQHFNSSPEAENVLLDNGWTLDRDTSQFTQYTRPGKDGGTSASYIKDKRIFHMFTTSTEFEAKNYDPASLLCALQFNNDYKKLYAHLVKLGFGEHKATYEAKVIRKAAETNKPLPPNFSPEAQTQLQVAVQQKSEKYPHGIFWEYDPRSDNYTIQRKLLENFMFNLGLRHYYGEPCIIEGQFLRKLKEDKKKNGDREVFNVITDWIREEEEEIYNKIYHQFSKFWQSSGEFMLSVLKPLDHNLILRSNHQKTYKVFENGILEITPDSIMMGAFSIEASKLIWTDEIIPRKFRYVPPEERVRTMYVDYLKKAINGGDEYVMTCIGWLCCEYKVASESYLLALMEPADTNLGGGTGKNFYCYILSHWTTILTTNGQAINKDVDQLIQNWNGERVVHLSDMPKWVNLSNIKHIITDDSQRKLLYKDIQNVRKEDMPKFVISGQFGINTEDDGGVRRRVRQLAFSGYFHGDGAIRNEYGGNCPDVWDQGDREGCNDWDGYYSYIADAVRMYLGKRKIEIVEDLGLWMKGFDARYSGGDSYLRDAIEDKVDEWGKLEYVTYDQIAEWYNNEVTSGINSKFKINIKSHRLHNAMKEYGEKTGRFVYKSGGESKREYVGGKQQHVVRIKILKEEENWIDEKNGDVGEEPPF